MMTWHFSVGDWGFPLLIAFLILVGIALLPWFFFLLNLQNLLNRVGDRNRAMPSGHVWLNFIPVFNLGWFVYTVVKVRDSVRNEYVARGWQVTGDLGYNVGLWASILLIASVFLSWIPVIGWGISVAYLICWIIYWVRMADLKHKLDLPGTWAGQVGPYGYPGHVGPAFDSSNMPQAGGMPPSGMPYAPPYIPPTGGVPQPGAQFGASPLAASPPATSAPTSQGTGMADPGSEPPMVSTQPAGTSFEAPSQTPPASCAACGAPSDSGDRFCRTCGQPLD